jgi:hypothetical protein
MQAVALAPPARKARLEGGKIIRRVPLAYRADETVKQTRFQPSAGPELEHGRWGHFFAAPI